MGIRTEHRQPEGFLKNERLDKVSLVSIYVLVHRTCATFIETNPTAEEFYPYMDKFVETRLKNKIHKAAFRFILSRFKKMNFKEVKKECLEIPEKMAEKDEEVFQVLTKYEVFRLTS